MQTMQPVILHGCTTWDQERLPVDEFGERLKAVQKIIRDNGLSGLIVYGDCRDYSKLCYLTNYIPRHSWGMVLVPACGSPCLLANVAGTRDLPFVRLLTWIEDIRPAKNAANEIKQFIKDMNDNPNNNALEQTIGICGGEQMRHFLYKEIATECQQYNLKNVDMLIEPLLHRKRPREITVIREATNLLKSAVDAMQVIYSKGGSVMSAVIEADRVARNLGAQDVRLLYSIDFGLNLRPIEALSEERNDPLIAYIAIEYLGYWVEAMVTLTQKQKSPAYNKASQLLDFYKTTVRSGVGIEQLVESSMEIIKPFESHPVTQGRFGHSIGLYLQEKPLFELSFGQSKIYEETIYTVHAGLTDNNKDHALLSAIILINQNGNEILWSSV
ncbi:MAG: hypothetical protein KGZ96_14475 [Clostridia bacterium]|nr:hypothetical protein [Clostridia bacterium]